MPLILPSLKMYVLYTCTPDPIVDFHPDHANVIFAAGFSGGGFKMGAEIGNLLAHMATNRAEELDHDLKRLALERFNVKSNL